MHLHTDSRYITRYTYTLCGLEICFDLDFIQLELKSQSFMTIFYANNLIKSVITQKFPQKQTGGQTVIISDTLLHNSAFPELEEANTSFIRFSPWVYSICQHWNQMLSSSISHSLPRIMRLPSRPGGGRRKEVYREKGRKSGERWACLFLSGGRQRGETETPGAQFSHHHHTSFGFIWFWTFGMELY